jgi:hypothetical protein
MTGVRMGEQVLQFGCAHGGRLAAITGTVGLSGRAVAVCLDTESAERARKSAERAGILLEVVMAPPGRAHVDAGTFDLVVIDDTGGMFADLRAEDRVAMVRDAYAALRPGGRVMVIGSAPRGGLGALLHKKAGTPGFNPVASLEADGFRTARVLAEREGLQFVEALKPRT